MHLIKPLKNEFCFDLPMFSKKPATSINSYFYKMTLDVFYKGETGVSNQGYIQVRMLRFDKFSNNKIMADSLLEPY